MTVTNNEVRRISTIALIVALMLVSFLILKPILISIIVGLILAYAFLPLYRRILRGVKSKNASALLVCTIIALAILIPLWFLTPMLIQQTLDLFSASQTFNIGEVINKVFPGSSEQFKIEVISMASTFIGKATAAVLNTLIGFVLDLPVILLHVTVVMFVFFFTMRDYEKLRDFISDISPFKREKEKILAMQFRDVTSSVVYGYIIVGIIQGIAAGIGFYIFGVPRALVLTILAMFASILPMVGPWLIWIPVAIYLFSFSSTGMAIGFTIYSLLFVSMIDNFLRPYIVSRRTGTSAVIILTGMIGGLFVFGIMGILLGPLILSYLIVFLSAYRNRTISDLFRTE